MTTPRVPWLSRTFRPGSLARIFALSLFAVLQAPSATSTPTHSGAFHLHASPSHVLEHAAALKLVKAFDATNVAVRSGNWTAPETWRGGALPAAGARIWIPDGVKVSLTSSLLDTRIEWIRVDGSLRLDQDRDTGLKVVTIVVSETGSFEIGSATSPVRPDKKAVVEFADRGPRDRVHDPMDLCGGMIALGRVQIFGAPVTGHVRAPSAIVPGQQAIEVGEAPKGWKAGDVVVIPGTNPLADEDEVIRIANVDTAHRLIMLEAPLHFAHAAPQGAHVRIGNLTRNVVFISENDKQLASRGHLMVMHVATGVTIDGAGFYGLGRTDTRKAHTVPVLDAAGSVIDGTDANTIGRYPVHFHIRSNAHFDRPPNVVRNSVVMDSPKHGVVNHGGNVVAEGNVTFRVDGAHFFAENGSEIGVFGGNLAVRSAGSELSHLEDGLMSRMYIYDFGHGGYGFWLQGGGVKVIDNFAFGHRAAAYAINGNMMREGEDWIFFAPANLSDPSIGKGNAEFHPGDVPLLFSGNQGAASFNGLIIWYCQITATHSSPSVVENSFFWGLERHGVDLPYTRNFVFRNVTVLGSGKDSTSFGFGNTNNWADALVFDRVRAVGFAIGIDLPTKGYTRISDSELDNVRNIRVRGGPGSDLDVDIDSVRFGTSGMTDILMDGFPKFTREVKEGTVGSATMMPGNGDLSPFFGRVRVIVKNRGEDPKGRQIYFPEQAADAVPFGEAGVAQLKGKTSAQIWKEFGLAIGGTLAPKEAAPMSRIVGLVGPPANYPRQVRLASDRFTKVLAGYVPRVRDEQGQIREAPPVELKSGWNVIKYDAAEPAVLVFAGNAPPRFETESGFRAEIHPLDLQFGIRIRGNVVNQVGEIKSSVLIAKEFKPLVPGADGIVHIELPIEDGIGNRTIVPIALQVTDKAVRRGSNSLFYTQGTY